MATTRTRVGSLSVALLLAYAAPALAHSTSSGVGHGAHPVSGSSANGAASESGNSSAGSEGSSAGSGQSSAASADSSAASNGTSAGSTDSTDASEGSSNSQSSGSSEQQEPQPEDPPDDEISDATATLIASSALGTATASTVGSVLLTIFAVNELSAELYLRSNGHALRHHITRGAGDALEDLAHLCGVPAAHYASFAEATRQARHTLVEHLQEPRAIDAEETRAFLRALAEALSQDQELTAALIAGAYAG